MPKNSLKTTASAPIETLPEAPLGDRESLKILIIGSRRGVTGTIQTLHRLRFAEVREWSPLIPTATSGEVMSILSRYILAE
ncbi:hypothetical protein JOY44_04325 [Phormidium sp. CLA17]|uniref:hypothetical protein n=1 Tax=Leptolyngbya sp. Cla-17 TaxID=2803751 RepID=UPI001490DAE4|nr:hypothetical protein [Leptolyngbya sp. Cla-17]MBM0740849.1 hypothetical protein [Leptolyngbya sp. Cla-17]